MGNAAPTLGPLSQPPGPVPVVKPDEIMAEYNKGIGLSAALSGSQKLDLQGSITFRTMAKVQSEIDKIQQQINNLGTKEIDIASREGYAKLLDPLTKLLADLNSSYTRILVDSAKLKESEASANPEDTALKQSLLRAQAAASNASAGNSAAQAAEATARQKQIELATAIAEATSPATIEAAKAAAATANINLEKSKLELAAVVLANEYAKAKNIISDQVTSGEIDWNEARKQIAIIDGKFSEYEQTEIQRAQLTLAQKQLELSEAGVTGVYQGLPTIASRQLSLAEQEAAASQNYREAQLTIQQAAEARAATQARAQNMQALTSAQTQRQAAYNQAATEYERFGVATPNRIQGLQDLKAPLPAAQAAGMLGLDVNSPEFKAVYDTYSMALAPGQGAQQPTQPAPAAPAPAPEQNPVTNSIPLISMPSMGNTPYLTQALNGLRTGYSPA